MWRDSYTSAEVEAMCHQHQLSLEKLTERCHAAEQRLAAGGLVERAALVLWGASAAEVVTLRNFAGQINTEYLQALADQCWAAAAIFARRARSAAAELQQKGEA